MKRQAIEDMKRWKESPRRKPLIVSGARQVGKTWLMKEFGRAYFRETAYITFDDNPSSSPLSKDRCRRTGSFPYSKLKQASASTSILCSFLMRYKNPLAPFNRSSTSTSKLPIFPLLRADRRSDLRCGGGSERKISRRRGLHSLWGKCAFSISTLSVSGSF